MIRTTLPKHPNLDDRIDEIWRLMMQDFNTYDRRPTYDGPPIYLREAIEKQIKEYAQQRVDAVYDLIEGHTEELERIVYQYCDPMAMPDDDAAVVETIAQRRNDDV